jgi:hypothetical protein
MRPPTSSRLARCSPCADDEDASTLSRDVVHLGKLQPQLPSRLATHQVVEEIRSLHVCLLFAEGSITDGGTGGQGRRSQSSSARYLRLAESASVSDDSSPAPSDGPAKARPRQLPEPTGQGAPSPKASSARSLGRAARACRCGRQRPRPACGAPCRAWRAGSIRSSSPSSRRGASLRRSDDW